MNIISIIIMRNCMLINVKLLKQQKIIVCFCDKSFGQKIYNEGKRQSESKHELHRLNACYITEI